MIFNRERETMSQGDREALQLRQLQTTLERVYENNSYYKNALDEANVKPSDVKSLDDIRRLPFLTKKILRENYPTGLFAAPQSEIVRYHASSGTSGKPTLTAYTKNDIEVWAEVIARSIVAAGGRPSGILHNAYGYGLFTGGLGLHHGGEKLG
ncbi:MAG TPA: phenylacetate--CoA ligase, partial [Pseudogracilibacillus sp.]|nr:phenylacetate--CoA ligase [Pseudogracilibacillus sp.]